MTTVTFAEVGESDMAIRFLIIKEFKTNTKGDHHEGNQNSLGG